MPILGKKRTDMLDQSSIFEQIEGGEEEGAKFKLTIKKGTAAESAFKDLEIFVHLRFSVVRTIGSQTNSSRSGVTLNNATIFCPEELSTFTLKSLVEASTPGYNLEFQAVSKTGNKPRIDHMLTFGNVVFCSFYFSTIGEHIRSCVDFTYTTLKFTSNLSQNNAGVGNIVASVASTDDETRALKAK